MAEQHPTNLANLDTAEVTAIVGGAVAIVGGMVAGLWKWLADRPKASMDAQASLLAGFVSLLTSVQNERDRLIGRLGEMEDHNHQLDRRISKLERIMMRHNIEIPNGEGP